MPRWTQELWRQLIAFGIGTIALLVPGPVELKSMVFWDIFAVSYLVLTGLAFRGRKTVELSTMVRARHGQSRWVRSLYNAPDKLAQSAAMTALAFTGVTLPKALEIGPTVLVLTLGTIAVAASWLMLQVGFAIHYLSLYAEHGGLEFPGDQEPWFVDFAYFAFAVGTTFGTTDVTVTDRRVRRTVLVHSALAFFFNTFILALTVSLVTSSLF